jgi:hypothetical protein
MSYDPTQEPKEFIADDRDEAVAKACKFYRVEESDLVLKEMQPGEVHGLGARAVVVALPKELVGRERPASDSRDRDRGPRERGGRERGGRERGGRDRGGREAAMATVVAAMATVVAGLAAEATTATP